MPRKRNSLWLAFGFMMAVSASAQASPTCLKEKKPFALTDDTINWTMTAAPGSECIQGLRWSYMQIYNVVVSKAPTKGRLQIVGSGFRYFADADGKEADSFVLEVWGKNLRIPGKSTIEIAVKPSLGTVVGQLPLRP